MRPATASAYQTRTNAACRRASAPTARCMLLVSASARRGLTEARLYTPLAPVLLDFCHRLILLPETLPGQKERGPMKRHRLRLALSVLGLCVGAAAFASLAGAGSSGHAAASGS